MEAQLFSRFNLEMVMIVELKHIKKYFLYVMILSNLSEIDMNFLIKNYSNLRIRCVSHPHHMNIYRLQKLTTFCKRDLLFSLFLSSENQSHSLTT